MSMLFVPLTTLAVQDLHGKTSPGTGLNNMMRQLGGSFGIAILTTLIHIKSGVNRNIPLKHQSLHPGLCRTTTGLYTGFSGQRI